MIFDFDFELLLYDICCDELWYETNNNHQKKSSKFESDIHIIALFNKIFVDKLYCEKLSE